MQRLLHLWMVCEIKYVYRSLPYYEFPWFHQAFGLDRGSLLSPFQFFLESFLPQILSHYPQYLLAIQLAKNPFGRLPWWPGYAMQYYLIIPGLLEIPSSQD